MGLSAHAFLPESLYTPSIIIGSKRMKSGHGFIVFGCGLIAGICGAALHWNEGDGCMIPAPITGIFTGISWSAVGSCVGFVFAAIWECVVADHKMYQEPKV